MSFWGGIEAGGTKFVCGVCSHDGEVLDRISIATRDPDSTVQDVLAYFERMEAVYTLKGIGLASFGPIDLNPDSETYGFITTTPKNGWQFFDIKGTFERELNQPIPLDTDVNAAVLAEKNWGAAVGLNNVVYITVGTGIGGGILVNGSLVHGLLHPEIGHMRIRTNDNGESFKGVCPYHFYCLEGMASGAAMKERWGIMAEDLDRDHPAWELEASYLAEGIANIIYTVSPDLIILGGGVMSQKHLFPLLRRNVTQLLNGYIQKSKIIDKIDAYIVPPKLGNDVGLLGAAALRFEKEIIV
jgi:fructokinase